MSSLYVHIPFCKNICAYCDFPKVILNEEWTFSYINSLFKELSILKKKKYDTIYIGGGTPTSLNAKLLEELLKKLRSYLKDGGEFSIETNSDCLDDTKLTIIKKYDVNRISIGVESRHEHYLRLMKRTHTYLDVINIVNKIKNIGINNINVDLIYDLPLESDEEILSDIENVLKLKVPHISTYSLSVSNGTIFYNLGYKEANDIDSARHYELILNKLREHNYIRYEVSNFALEGYECKHNLTYWKDEHYDAIGLGACGYIDNIRYTNTRNFNKYVAGKYIEEKEIVKPVDDLKYYFLTNLRLEEGFSLNGFKDRFGFSFFKNYEKEFNELKNNNLLIEKDGRIMPTDQGILLLDRILLTLFK